VDNITHSLLGATLAELALPAGAPRVARRTFFAAGVVAANLPDADLVYTRITPAPLGALLHHRGHTHTVAGLVLLGLAMVAVCLVPRVRDGVPPTMRGRLWTLIGVALASHLLLDAWNSYGVHPFWPLTSRWYYGDAVFILEPWIWLLLGVSAVANTVTSTSRVIIGAALAGITSLGAYFRQIPVVALIMLLVAALVLAIALRRHAPRRRAAVALALAVAFVTSLFGLRELVRAEVLTDLGPVARPRVVDVVLSPNAANPLCWTVLAVVRDESGDGYVLRHGDVAVGTRSGCGGTRPRAVAWDAAHVQSIARLRALSRADCWVRAWLQFGRAPEISDGTISDARYGGTSRGNFTTMALKPPAEAARCPANLTAWTPPRADLLGVEVAAPTGTP
jgi:inner membrane protein